MHQAISANLGSRVAAWLYDRLTEACVRPPGMGHLEDPKLTADLTVAREFDAGMTGPPMHINMDFIAGGPGPDDRRASPPRPCSSRYAWWAPLVLAGAWLATHWFLRESAVWRDRNTEPVRDGAAARGVRLPARRGPARGQGAAPLRPGRLGDGAVRRPADAAAPSCSTRRRACGRGRSPGACCSWPPPTSLVFWSLASAAASGRLDLGRLVVFAQVAVGVSADRLRRPELGARRRRGAGGRGAAPRAGDGRAGRARGSAAGAAARPTVCPRARSASATSRSPTRAATGRCSRASTSRSRPARRSRSSGRTARARRRSPSCSAASTTRRAARSRWTGWTCATSTSTPGARGSPPSSRTSSASSCRCATTSRRAARPTTRCCAALADAGAAGLATLDTPLARGYEGGTELSGGQWQRVALARALCAVRLGAGLVLLDEPTAQLDVRGEAEIFDRILAATRKVTTILISHRFSTVRHADRICVLEHGRVVELGHPRRADGAGRPLPHDVRAAGPALRRRRGRGGSGL